MIRLISMRGTRTKRREWAFFSLALLVVAVDQGTKLWIMDTLFLGQSVPLLGPVRLTYITNTGTAFGLFQNQAFLLVFAALLGVAALFFYYWRPPWQSPWLTAGLAMQMGGAVGNLIDRLQYGHVIDFIDLRVWPVFNLADSAIVVGVGLLLYPMLFPPRRQ